MIVRRILYVLAGLLLFPFLVHAFPFGGQAKVVLPCYYNQTIYAVLGLPNPGAYVWTTATKTYPFGPPKHAGQWLLGIAGRPYYCIYHVGPNIIWSATRIEMMGSSQ